MFKNVLRGFFHRLTEVNLKSDFLHKVIITLSTRILLLIIGVLTTIVIVRLLGPEGRGLYALAMTCIGIGIQLGTLGFHASNTYYVAQDSTLLSILLGNSLLLSLVAGIAVALLVLIIVRVWPDILPFDNTLLSLILLGFPIALAYVLIQSLLVGLHEIQFFNGVELLNKTLALLFIGFCVLSHIVTVSSVFMTAILALTVVLIMSLFQLKKHSKEFPRCSFYFFQCNFGFGFKAYLVAFFSFLVLRFDLWMVEYLLGTKEAGYYSIATAMSDMIYVFPMLVGKLLFPRLSAEQDIREKQKKTKLVALLIAVIMSVITFLVVLVIEPVVRVAFGSEFLLSVQPFLWLLPGIVCLSINSIFMNYFASVDMPLIVVFFPVFAFFLNVFLNLYFIPSYGMVGAAFSSSIAYFVMLVFSLTYFSIGYRQRAFS